MGHISYTELRANLAKYMDEVCDSRDALPARLIRSIESADAGRLTEHEIIEARPDAK
jgi:hypothetical protein